MDSESRFGRVLATHAAVALLFAASCFSLQVLFAEFMPHEAGAFLKSWRIPYVHETNGAAKMDYASRPGEPNDIVFLGDSAGLNGLITKRFERSTGLKAYNLSTFGVMGLKGYEVILKNYLENHPRPKYVVLLIFPRLMRQETTRDPVTRDLFVTCYGKGAPARFDPRERRRSAMRVFGGRLRGGAEHFHGVPRGMYPSHLQTLAALERERGFQPGLGSDDVAPMPFDSIVVSGWFRRELVSFMDLARSAGVTVVLRTTPFIDNNDHIDIREFSGEMEALERSYGGDLVIVPPYFHTMPKRHFVKYSHLNQEGAVIFTDRVASDMRSLQD